MTIKNILQNENPKKDKGTAVTSYEELQLALQSGVKKISIAASFHCPNSVVLDSGISLEGVSYADKSYPTLSFYHKDGVGVTANNSISKLNLDVSENQRAVFLASWHGDLGIFSFSHLILKGQFSFVTYSDFTKAVVNVSDVNVVAADARFYIEQPHKYNVNILQGGFTVYNMCATKSDINLTVRDLSVGQRGAPVVGSGVFIAGYGDTGGTVSAPLVHVKGVYSNGKIPVGISNLITATFFISTGAFAQEIILSEEVVSYGNNDMVIDFWGRVGKITCQKAVISYGPSAIGFVNFGVVEKFIAKGEVITYGLGSRGYNQYDGTVNEIEFSRIETFADGAVGIQISKKIGSLKINGGITTHGSVGNSLVKGVIVKLPADAISIISGGEVDNLTVGKNIETHGDEVTSYSVNLGVVHKFTIGGDIVASGKKSQKTFTSANKK